ncbi:MAG: hypothetical protein O2783_01170 [Chloroflexi bacterium]|nr:hypothetical protein [Chloroflexota bacterium]
MPNKSRRVASKQAELRERKRRAPKHHSGVEASIPAARIETATPGMTPRATPAAPTLESRTPDARRSVIQERRAPVPAARTHNPYIWPEIKRIGIITALVLMILAVFTVVLR